MTHLNLGTLKMICKLSSGCRSPVYQCEACPFRHPANHGNGAREAAAAFFVDDCAPPPGLTAGDFLLAWLWSRGFKVVPVDTAADD